uniref:Ig-like domain-containing protein n=1 Tax=Astyanax mexicanus TaxID=7994 RepID=A0A3B1JL49_ASTMX
IILNQLIFFIIHIRYVETGTSCTFNPTVTAAYESVLWKFNNDKVVEFEDGSVKWVQFEKQGDFDENTGDLTLNGLKKTQSGLYESEILVSGTLQTKKYEIQVIDAVPQPQVTCIRNSEGEVTSLECSVYPEVEVVTFIWSGPGFFKSPGKTLQITAVTDRTTTYTCTAKNPVSEKHSEIFLKDFTLPCHILLDIYPILTYCLHQHFNICIGQVTCEDVYFTYIYF